MKTRIVWRTLLVYLLFSAAVFGQEFKKKDFVLLKFSNEIGTFDKIKIWSAVEQYVVNIAGVTGEYTLNGNSTWRDGGLPSMTQYWIDDLNISKKKPSEIFVAIPVLRKRFKLVIPTDLDVQAVLSTILFKGTPDDFRSSSYLQELVAERLPKIFVGSLKSVPLSKQKELVLWANLEADAFGEKSFKDKTYLSVKTSEDVVYNTIQLNQAERAARQTQYALKRIREFYNVIGKVDGFDGIRAFGDIASYDFVAKNEAQHERFEMYLPIDEFKRFMNADITNQELVDAATILLDGSRIKVNLTSFS